MNTAHDAMDETGEWAAGRPRLPAEACTDLGHDDSQPRPGFLRRLVLGLRLRYLRHQLGCLLDERDRYTALSWAGPIYLRNSFQQELQLRARIRQLEPLA